jgi:ABC-type ATPase with predicted acetyltransferase domain
MPEYEIDIRFATHVQRTPRVLECAEAFGLGLDDQEFVVFDHLKLTVEPRDVIYITGQSGAGKSVLLRDLAAKLAADGKTVANIDAVQLDADRPIVDQIGKDTNEALHLLATVGINDAFLYLRRPGELSDGQRYRLKLAKVIEAGASVWVADEFCAVLDRTTAKVIAFALQKLARQQGAILLVATTHTDLVADLYPSLTVEKRFREKVRAVTFPGATNDALNAPASKADIYALIDALDAREKR